MITAVGRPIDRIALGQGDLLAQTALAVLGLAQGLGGAGEFLGPHQRGQVVLLGALSHAMTASTIPSVNALHST